MNLDSAIDDLLDEWAALPLTALTALSVKFIFIVPAKSKTGCIRRLLSYSKVGTIGPF